MAAHGYNAYNGFGGSFAILGGLQDSFQGTLSEESDDSEENSEIAGITIHKAESSEKTNQVGVANLERRQSPERFFSPPLASLKQSPSLLQLTSSSDSITPPSIPSPRRQIKMTEMEEILSTTSSECSGSSRLNSKLGSPILQAIDPAKMLDRVFSMRTKLNGMKIRLEKELYNFFVDPNALLEKKIHEYSQIVLESADAGKKELYGGLVANLTLLMGRLNDSPSAIECTEIFKEAYSLLFSQEVPDHLNWLINELSDQYSRFGIVEVKLPIQIQLQSLDFYHPHKTNVDTLLRGLGLVFDNSCLIDTHSYLDNRLTGDAVQHMLKHPDKIDVFLGSSEDMRLFYQREFGATKCYAFKQASSFTVHLFVDDENQTLIVLSQIDSEENLIHRLYQLHFAGVDIKDICIRGTFIPMVTKKIKQFADRLFQHSENRVIKPMMKLLIIGNTAEPMTALSRLSHVGENKLDWQVLKQRFKTVYSLFFFVSRTFMFDTQKLFIAAVRMPPGKMAGDLTQKLLEMYNFDYLFMAGAGGAILDSSSNPEVKIGDYLQFSEIHDTHGDVINVPRNQRLSIEAHASALPHYVVQSPLAETREWQHQMQGHYGSVDVKAGIVSAFKHHRDRTSRITAGVRISDSVNRKESDSLKGKMSAKNAGLNTTAMMSDLMHAILQDMKTRHPQKSKSAPKSAFKRYSRSRRKTRAIQGGSGNHANWRVAAQGSIRRALKNVRRGRVRDTAKVAFTPNPQSENN